jgi:hypothetical protein
MGLVKCPRCELNYILDGGALCTICRREVRGESEHDDIAELCSECGENPAISGGELCMACLRERNPRGSENDEEEDELEQEDLDLEDDSVATMDEIAIDIDDPMESFDADDGFDDDGLDDAEDDLSDGNRELA